VVKLSALKLAWRSTYLIMIFLAVIGALMDDALYPAAIGNLEQQASQAMVNRRSRRKLGTNIHTPITGAPMSHEDLLARLRYYAAGRCPIG